MRWIAFGVEPVGVVAIGANATGVVAIGQLATGVFAAGQMARGVVTLGQLSIGVVAVGQLTVGVIWGMGQLGIAAFGGPGIVWGPLGRLWMLRLLGREPGPVITGSRRLGGASGVFRVLVVVAVVVLWYVAAGTGVMSGIGDIGGKSEPGPTTTTTHILR